MSKTILSMLSKHKSRSILNTKNLNFSRFAFLYISMLVCLINMVSCHPTPEKIQTIIKNSPNGIETKKVIDYYEKKGETDKIKAAYFLLQNMPDHFHYEGEGQQNYHNMFKKVGSLETPGNLERTWDSVAKKLDYHFSGKATKTPDIATLKASDLIKHIDAAFIARNYPWAKSLSFDEFCEYILPYKLINENPDLWIIKVQKEYNWLLDKMRGNDDYYDACILINDRLKKNFRFDKFPVAWDVNYGDLNLIKSGACYHATQYASYIMRAMGLPVVMDFTPYWGNMNGGHDWNALIYHNKPIPFVGAESNPGYTKIDLAFQRKRAKIFRRTYSSHTNKLKELASKDHYIPTFLKSKHIQDVTKEYIPVSDVNIKLNGIFPDTEHALLCVFNEQKWTPIFSGLIDDHQNATFEGMGREVVYIPMYTEMGNLIPAGKPFIITKEGVVDSISCNPKQKTSLTIRKKGYHGPNIMKGNTYELYYWDSKWMSLGKITAQADTLVYKSVPKDALFWVRSSDKSSKERIFTYKDNKQIWW